MIDVRESDRSGARGRAARAASLIGGRRWWFAALVIASLGAGVAEATVLVILAHAAAAMSIGGAASAIDAGPLSVEASTGTLLIVAGGLSIARFGLQLAIAQVPARLSAEVQSRLRRDLFDAYTRATWSAKASDREGHLQELMGGHVAQAGAAVLQLAATVTAALAFAVLVASALVLSVPVALGVMATAALLFSALRPLSRRVRRLSQATSAALVDQASHVAEAIRLAQEVEVFGVDAPQRARIDEVIATVERRFFRARAVARITPVVYQNIVMCLLVGGLAALYAIGTDELAALGAVVLILIRASSYGQQFQTAYQALGEAGPYVDRIDGSIRRLRDAAAHRGTHVVDRFETIAFDRVSFAYHPGRDVLHDISFDVDAGEAIGIIGPSGAGKSTLVQLLLRLRDPTDGEYRMNGLPAAAVDPAAFTRLVAHVPQDPALLSGTVADNIRFFRAGVDDAAVEQAARLAHIHDEIVSWPDGYDTIIGQRAAAVSGGQRQRLCIARALAGRPQLLVLDEPTSALDAHSEQVFRASLDDLHGRATLVVVAHRLSTLSLCDRVMVLDDGGIAAFAPPTVLYRDNAFYRGAIDMTATVPSGAPMAPGS